MSFVYFNIWQIKQTEPKHFAMGLIGFGKDIEKSLLEATSPFVFSTVNERSILRFLKLIACDNGKIGTHAKLVDDRNETAYPNGNIFLSEQSALDLKIIEILRVVEKIQTHSNPIIERCYHQRAAVSGDPGCPRIGSCRGLPRRQCGDGAGLLARRATYRGARTRRGNARRVWRGSAGRPLAAADGGVRSRFRCDQPAQDAAVLPDV